MQLSHEPGEALAEIERWRTLAEERARHVDLLAAVGRALVGSESLADQLRHATEALVEGLDAAFGGIWTIRPADRRLERRASAGVHVPVDLEQRGVPIAAAALRQIAEERKPRSSNDLAHGAAILDGKWALEEKVVSFAGCPLLVEGEVVGVVAMIARHPLSPATVEALGSVADQIALSIARASSIQLQRQDEAALQKLTATLERRVEERTRELETANRELEAFSYSVSHDLRAPIRHISGFAEMLQKHCLEMLDPRGVHYLRTISLAAKQAGALIDDLLSFSRVARTEVSLSEVDLNQLVASCRREVLTEAGGRPIEWRIGKLPKVCGDPAMLRLVIRNLLSNALKYTRKQEHPVVEVGSKATGTELTVYVKDNGVGFDMQHAHKLFGVFQRLHPADEFEGTGIGLANVRRIVERHGGRTGAEAAVGSGATFFFTLPVR